MNIQEKLGTIYNSDLLRNITLNRYSSWSGLWMVRLREVRLYGESQDTGNMVHILFPMVFMVTVTSDGGWDLKTLQSSSPGQTQIMQPLLQRPKSPTSHKTQSVTHLFQQSLNI